jgi:hypothetical protein
MFVGICDWLLWFWLRSVVIRSQNHMQKLPDNNMRRIEVPVTFCNSPHSSKNVPELTKPRLLLLNCCWMLNVECWIWSCINRRQCSYVASHIEFEDGVNWLSEVSSQHSNPVTLIIWSRVDGPFSEWEFSYYLHCFSVHIKFHYTPVVTTIDESSRSLRIIFVNSFICMESSNVLNSLLIFRLKSSRETWAILSREIV